MAKPESDEAPARRGKPRAAIAADAVRIRAGHALKLRQAARSLALASRMWFGKGSPETGPTGGSGGGPHRGWAGCRWRHGWSTSVTGTKGGEGCRDCALMAIAFARRFLEPIATHRPADVARPTPVCAPQCELMMSCFSWTMPFSARYY